MEQSENESRSETQDFEKDEPLLGDDTEHNDENQSIDGKKIDYHVENELNNDRSTWNANAHGVNDSIPNQNIDHETSIGADRPRRKNAGVYVSRLDPNFNLKEYSTV